MVSTAFRNTIEYALASADDDDGIDNIIKVTVVVRTIFKRTYVDDNNNTHSFWAELHGAGMLETIMKMSL